MPGNFVHNDTVPDATIGREDRPWYAMYADDVYATDVHGDIEGTTGINEYIQDALDLKAPLASPALTGTPTASTAPVGTATTQLATTEFVANEIDAIPAATDTTDGLMSANDHVAIQYVAALCSWVVDADNGYRPVIDDANLNPVICLEASGV